MNYTSLFQLPDEEQMCDAKPAMAPLALPAHRNIAIYTAEMQFMKQIFKFAIQNKNFDTDLYALWQAAQGYFLCIFFPMSKNQLGICIHIISAFTAMLKGRL